MDRTQSISNIFVISPENSIKSLRTVLSRMIRTRMFYDFLVEDLKACRTEAEKEVVCFALKGAKTRMRHLQKRLKKLLASEPCRRADLHFAAAEN